MKITCISDTHNKHTEIDTILFLNTDILIHAGDFTSRGTKSELIAFLEWFESIEVPHKVLIAGNHDFFAASLSFIDILKDYPSIKYLYNSTITINGLKIWGSPYSNVFGSWAFMEEELELADIWETVPKDTNIVVTHGPAYGIGDLVDNDYKPNRDKHVGSKTLLAKLKSLKKLKLHVVGHIHTGYGVYFTTNYVTINGSQLNDSYKVVNLPKSITI